MTDQSSVFEQEKPQETPEQTTTPLDAYQDQLASIKNESGEQKYKTLDDALKALAHSQEFIPQVKGELASKDQELAELKAKLEAAGSVQEMVQKLAEQKDTTPEDTTQVAGLDEQAVVNLFEKLSGEKAAANLRKTNSEQVNSALQSKFGDKAKEVVAAKANELGLSLDQLKQMSENSPKVVMELFGAKTTTTPTPTTGSYNLPQTQVDPTEVPPPEKSLLRGASAKDQLEYMKKIKAAVYAKYNVQ